MWGRRVRSDGRVSEVQPETDPYRVDGVAVERVDEDVAASCTSASVRRDLGSPWGKQAKSYVCLLCLSASVLMGWCEGGGANTRENRWCSIRSGYCSGSFASSAFQTKHHSRRHAYFVAMQDPVDRGQI